MYYYVLHQTFNSEWVSGPRWIFLGKEEKEIFLSRPKKIMKKRLNIHTRTCVDDNWEFSWKTLKIIFSFLSISHDVRFLARFSRLISLRISFLSSSWSTRVRRQTRRLWWKYFVFSTRNDYQAANGNTWFCFLSTTKLSKVFVFLFFTL